MTEEYEKALAKYYNKLRLLPLPLISWNIFYTDNLEMDSFNSIQEKWNVKEDFLEIVYQTKREIIITNTNNEILFASNGIRKMNGYRPFEIIGKSPKLFQGELTSKKSRENIRKAIQNQLPFKEVIVNYKKDGTTYMCEIEAFPKFNKKGKLINYIAFERLAS